MSQSELERPRSAGRRARHDACDGLAVAALSLGASAVVVVAPRLALGWLR